MADNSIARVYQFLNNNYSSIDEWKKDVDERYGNKDGTVIKSEFNSFMLREFDFETDENPNDVINRFWASIDTKTTGKVGATGIANVNALDENELKTAEALLQISEQINVFMQDKPGEDLGISDINGWKNSVKTGMINKIADKLKGANMTIDKLDIQAEMEKAYQQTVRKATADYVKNDVVAKEIKNSADFSGVTYYPNDDKELAKVIDRYIKSLDNDEKTPLKQIVSDVEKLVKAYADTAKTNSQSSIDTLGSSYNANGKLNDLQMAVLVKGITDGITNKLTSDSQYKALNDAYGDMISEKIKPYVENELKGKKASEFTTIKNSISTYVDKFFTSEIADIEKEYNDLQTAKKELKDLLAGKYTNDKYKSAIKEVFGKETQADVEKIIDGYKTLDEVNEAKSKIEAKFEEIANMLDDSFFSALKDTVLQYGESQRVSLPNSTGKYSTNELSFKTENGNGNITVDSSGHVTISGNQVGTFKNVKVSVWAEGKKIGEKAITITVQESAASIVNNVTGWNGKTAQNLETVLPTGDDSCSINNRLTDDSFKDLYNNDAIVRLHLSMDDSESWDSAGNTINSRLDQLGQLIYAALMTSGSFDSSTLDTAVKNVISGYKNNKFADGCLNDDDDGTDGYDLTNNLVWRMRNDRAGTGHRVVGTRDDDGSDSWVWGVRFKDVVDDIIKEYNALSAGQQSTVTHKTNDTSGESDSHNSVWENIGNDISNGAEIGGSIVPVVGDVVGGVIGGAVGIVKSIFSGW